MKKIVSLILTGYLLCFGVSIAQTNTAVSKDFGVKGYHVDLRMQVIKMPALKAFVQKLKANGINTLIMEWEATFPFQKYPVIANQYSYTKEEITSFLLFCKNLGMDVIPLQQSFGHVEYILRNYRFASIREDAKDFSQVCPVEEEGNKLLFNDLFKELAATHPSKYFHIGGDETYLLGHCEKCKKKAAEVGLSKLYIDHIKMLCDIVISLGKRPVLWADIALKHPEAIKLLPKETVFIDWNYGWNLNQFGNLDNLLKSGYEIWGAPAIRSGFDNYYLSQWNLHFNNLRDFIPTARKIGYTGMVLTSWSTNGTFNPVFNSAFDIIEIYPRGHRYPFTGYNISLQAFFESLQLNTALNTFEFVQRYAQKTFGFTPVEAKKLWASISVCDYEIRQGKVVSPYPLTVQQVLDSTVMAAKTLRQLKPTKGAEEYAHFQLMADIRIQYLETYLVENQLNETTVTTADYEAIALKLKRILAKSADLDKRFIALNRSTFYEEELQNENMVRSQHIKVLYNRVTKTRSSLLTPAK
ncbi:MAG: beta-N-acetylhexosaminidase [Flavisolibacter sp.]|jgi:hypothetical protein|nr:beta-N-acetylhexosaminidase [Flavisolibacter sp.]